MNVHMALLLTRPSCPLYFVGCRENEFLRQSTAPTLTNKSNEEKKIKHAKTNHKTNNQIGSAVRTKMYKHEKNARNTETKPKRAVLNIGDLKESKLLTCGCLRLCHITDE